MMTVGAIGSAVESLRARLEALAVALVSRDGLVLHASLPAGVYAETFSIMCATVFGAAAAAHLELHQALPGWVVLEGPETRTFLVRSGSGSLLVAVLEVRGDRSSALTELQQAARQL